MVTLQNVKKENNILVAEYFPEDNKADIGRIEYDASKSEVVSVKYCRKDEESFLKTYSKKAVQAIKELLEKNEYPVTYTYMWY